MSFISHDQTTTRITTSRLIWQMKSEKKRRKIRREKGEKIKPFLRAFLQSASVRCNFLDTCYMHAPHGGTGAQLGLNNNMQHFGRGK